MADSGAEIAGQRPALRHPAQQTAYDRAPPLVPAPSAVAGRDSWVFSFCPELRCLRGLVADNTLRQAALRSVQINVGADRVLLASDAIDEHTYVAALARSLGFAVEPLDHRRRSECPLPDERLIDAAVTGLLPLGSPDGMTIAVAPLMAGSRNLAKVATSGSGVPCRVALTTSARLHRFVTSRAAAAIGERAASDLARRRPDFSAATSGATSWRAVCLAAAVTFALVLAPVTAWRAIEAALATVFLCWTGLRVLSMISAHRTLRPLRTYSDAELPIYTIIVALYREAAAVPGLVAALERIDYPPEKLDIKLVLEPGDDATIATVRRLRLRAPFEIVFAPQVAPQTKPKALNAALLFARGRFVAVYDAEDRPEPGQLRMALEAFAAGHERLACVQARLTIDNTADSWLTRLFTAEYAGLFDVLLPGLAHWCMPLPLGGSSNHFRTQVLRDAGGWDAHNVTEDADLGMRLARLGYETTMIASTTYEEAPARLRPWLLQRTRWFKGWMQTWLVHMRAPGRLLRELGPGGFAVFQLIVGGTVLAALVHQVFAMILLAEIITGRITSFPQLHITALLVGYLVSALLGAIGLWRRNLLAYGWALVLIPIYWLLLSAAAWRALVQLCFDPYRWEKTEHGLARTSRLAQQFENRKNNAAPSHR